MATIQNDRDNILQNINAFIPASNVTNASASVSSGLIRVTWDPCPDAGYDSTEVRLTDDNWGSNVIRPLYKAKASEFPYLVTAVGTYVFYIRHISNGNPSSASASITLIVSAENLPQTGSSFIRLSPSSAVLSTDQSGTVTNWPLARSTISVISPEGNDDTFNWSLNILPGSKFSASLGGPLNNQLAVTGLSANEGNSTYFSTIVQIPFAEDLKDYSKFKRTHNQSVQAAIINSSTPVGTGFLRLTADAWDSGEIRFGGEPFDTSADPSLVEQSGNPWDISFFIRIPSPVTSSVSQQVVHWGDKSFRLICNGPGWPIQAEFHWVHASMYSAGTWAMYDQINTTTSRTVLPLNTWVHLRASYCSDGRLRFWANGSLVSSTFVGSGRTDYFYRLGNGSSPDFLATRGSYLYFLHPQVNTDLTEFRILGSSGPLTNTFLVPTTRAKPYSSPESGSIKIEAVKSNTVLSAEFDISIINPLSATVQCQASPPSITLETTWDGTILSSSKSLLLVTVDGVPDPSWGFTVATGNAYSELGGYINNYNELEASSLNNNFSSDSFVVWFSKAGYLSQRVLVPVTKIAQAQPVVTVSGTTSVVVSSSWDQESNLNLPLSVSVVALEGTSVVTSSYSWNVSATAGITLSSTSGSTVSVTNMSKGTTSGTITFVGSRYLWPTITRTVSVSKTLAAQPTVVAGGPSTMSVQSDWSDTVLTNLPISATITAMNGSVNEASLYTWTRVDSPGITTSISGSTVTLASMLTGTVKGTITVTGTRNNWPSLTWNITVIKTLATQPTVTTTGPTSVGVLATWDDTGLLFLPIGGNVVAVDSSTGDTVTSFYTWSVSTTAGLSASNSGAQFSITNMSNGVFTGTVTMTGTRNGWPNLVHVIAVSKQLEPRPTVVAGGPAAVTVSGSVDGTVPAASYPVTFAVSAVQNGTNVANLYTWSLTATSGITATISGSTIEITNMTNSVDSGSISIQGIRNGWPNLFWTVSVQKTKLLPVVGDVTNWGPFYCYAFGSSSATSRIILKSDGRVMSRMNNLPSEVLEGNWYAPTAAGIGNSRWMKLVVQEGTAPTTPAANTILSLASGQTISVVRTTVGAVDGKYRVEIYSDSSGNTKVGEGIVYLGSEIS